MEKFLRESARGKKEGKKGEEGKQAKSRRTQDFMSLERQCRMLLRLLAIDNISANVTVSQG
jgi:hypothetical protein